MGDAVWFFHHKGRQLGPISWAELQAHAERGEIDPDDLVWQPKLAGWEPARAQAALFADLPPDSGIEEEPPAVWGSRSSVRSPSTVIAFLKPGESLLRAYGRALSLPTLNRIHNRVIVIGQVAYLLAAILATILMLVVGIQHREIIPILLAIAGIPVAIMLGLSAARVLAALRLWIDDSPTVLDGKLIPDAVAALAVGFGALTGVAGLALAVAGANVASVLGSIGASFLFFYLAGVALEPETVNVSLRNGRSTRDPVAALSFITKLVFLRLPPAVFMIAAIAAAVVVVIFFATSIGEHELVPEWVAVLVWGRVLSVALLPMAAWLVFVVVWTTLEVARSLITEEIGGE
jgi:hypothetical protein